MKPALTISLIFLTLYCIAQTVPGKKKFVKNNFRIQYPATWNIDTSKAMGSEVIFFSPLENDADKFRENVSVLIQDLRNQNINLEKYKEISEKQFRDMLTDGKIYESQIVGSDKNAYYRASYSMKQGIFHLKTTSFCYIKNEKAYLVSFSSELDQYDRYKKTAEEILHSFSLDMK